MAHHHSKLLNSKQYRMTFFLRRLLGMHRQLQQEGAGEAQCLAEIILTREMITFKNVSYEMESR